MIKLTTTAGAAVFLLLHLLLLTTITAQELKTFTTHFTTFNDSSRDVLNFLDYATINNNALQVTPDTAAGQVFSLTNRSGRVVLSTKFKLWDEKSATVASFNSSFLVNIFRPNNDTAGEGLAFVISPDENLPNNSYGQFLGLTNSTTDGNVSNKVVAVELDTVKQDFDPDDNHVGINVNSVRSVASKSLTPFNIQISPLGAVFHNVWVNYDGVTKVIRVYIAEQSGQTSPTPTMPVTPVLEYGLDLRQSVNQYSYFGFSASTGVNVELNCVLRWNLTVDYFPGKKSKGLEIGLGVGIPIAGIMILGLTLLGYWLYNRRMRMRSKSSILSRLRTLPGMPREFKFVELKKATNNFDEKRKLGQGGYGVVYRGVVTSENMEVAVKWFSRESMKGEDDFLAELTIINRLRHKHLVRLLGWCHKSGKLLLVYEYMPNGSLDMHLFSSVKDPLSWSRRYNIVSGVASALNYLHYEYDQQVVHRDIKASNIMLDSNFNARLGDFGLARALDNEKTSYAEADGVLGTIGYIAPECFHTGKATQHSDVYAFGAVLIEIVCGQRPGTKINGFQFLVDWVWSLHREGRLLDAVDEKLGKDYIGEEAERLLLLGLACSHPIANERPKTQTIVQIISGSVAVPKVPPFKPAFVWPAMMPIGDDTQATTIDTVSLTTSHFHNSDWSQQYLTEERDSGYTDHSMV